MKNCTNCNAELTDDQLFCPNCGAAVDNGKTEEQSETVVNDNIKWSDYQDVPLGSVEEHFSEIHGEETEEPVAESEILADYIRRHKEARALEEDQDKESSSEKLETESKIVEDSETENLEVTDVSEEVTIEKAVEEEPVAADNKTTQESPKTKPLETEVEAKVEPEERRNQPENTTPPKKSHMKKYLLGAAVVVLAGGGWLYFDHQQKAEAARQEQIRIDESLTQIASDLNGFFLDEEQQFILPEKTAENLTAVLASLADYSEEPEYTELSAKGEQIQEKLTVLDKINGFFTAPIVVGDQLQADVHINEGNDVDMSLLTDETPFAELVNQAIKQGQQEFDDLQAADKAVQKLLEGLQDDRLSDAVSRNDVEAAKKIVESLFDSPERTALLEKLKPVETALNQREADQRAAQQRAAQAAQEAAEEAARQAEQNQTTSPTFSEGSQILNSSTPTNSNNQPIIATRQSDIDDANNPAWTWAPGVKEEIIRIAIERGYVVEGGYKFERVRIENGEAYYNFFATNTQSSLMEGIGESALPFYLFTVNNQTGFFKGNGPN